MPMNITIGVDEKSSSPAILPNCHEDIMEDVAVAVKNTKILLSNGKGVTDFSCDSVPIRMTSWAINGSTNVLFICEKDGRGKFKFSIFIFCQHNKTELVKTFQKLK